MSQDLNKKVFQIPPIKSIQAFVQVAHCGSIVNASEILNITSSAVSHHIASLEKYLGKRLFNRTGKGVTLTVVGEQYLRETAGALNNIGIATERVMSNEEQQCLRIHSSPSFGLLWLLSRLDKFRTANPDLQLNLSCSYEALHFSRDKIDVDIRHGYNTWSTLDVKTIKNESVMVLASPEFLTKHRIKQPSDLLDCELIRSETTLVQWNQWFAYNDISMSNKNFALSFDRSYMSLEAACLGLGVALESNILAQEYLKQNKLVPVFESSLNIPVNAHHLVFPHNHAKHDRVKRFLNWIQAELAVSDIQI
ncbi:LysR substrate-binding domain-containing protein [Zophobihabitans entericus]|uniref:LysR family transcriptional regulator n=1 Tax=Zophobihabitans entericus TaxID=1635327 RepID=A0A6G9IC06_9GAMM|nr:LysR substrate-binding domain-containing protein [Zophobihabitans entericus]QIQ21367.1 LysR family transcriptional regulator [Zophobihabitans entericus]